jgi:hypothetical protein
LRIPLSLREREQIAPADAGISSCTERYPLSLAGEGQGERLLIS